MKHLKWLLIVNWNALKDLVTIICITGKKYVATVMVIGTLLQQCPSVPEFNLPNLQYLLHQFSGFSTSRELKEQYVGTELTAEVKTVPPLLEGILRCNPRVFSGRQGKLGLSVNYVVSHHWCVVFKFYTFIQLSRSLIIPAYRTLKLVKITTVLTSYL